jgi:hypothetical protein
LLAVLLLAACSVAPATSSTPGAEPPVDTTLSELPDAGAVGQADLPRSDSQGAVEFVVTPLNLSAPTATLDFSISMNTHSVDLGWDLAAQSVLRTDSGREVSGQSWPVGSGHHYQGTLSFPAVAADGQPLLTGATTLTLIINSTDVPERAFAWQIAR